MEWKPVDEVIAANADEDEEEELVMGIEYLLVYKIEGNIDKDKNCNNHNRVPQKKLQNASRIAHCIVVFRFI